MSDGVHKTVIVGMGEIGFSLWRLLAPHYDTWGVDTDPAVQERMKTSGVASPQDGFPVEIDVMHVCIRYSPDFETAVRGYMDRFKPRIVDVCSTVPPKTCEALGENVCHSTTRGLHPNLDEGLKTIRKHVGGPMADDLMAHFETAGIHCLSHRLARTTELAHVLNNAAYGINLVFADEMAKLCRHYGVDYLDAVTLYTLTNNCGYAALGHDSKRRMVLTPPGGTIGGHCVVQSAKLIPPELRTPMLSHLAHYNRVSDQSLERLKGDLEGLQRALQEARPKNDQDGLVSVGKNGEELARWDTNKIESAEPDPFKISITDSNPIIPSTGTRGGNSNDRRD